MGHYPVAGSDGLDIKWYGGIRLRTGTGTRIQVNDNGNVGINTESPTSKMEVFGNAGDGHLTISANDSTNDLSRMDIDFKIKNQNQTIARIATYYMDSANNGTGGLRFYTRLNGNLSAVMWLSPNGNMSISNKIEAKEVKVTSTPTADFVFEEDYALPKLEEVEKHIKSKKHLPEIASAKDMMKEGVNIGEFQIKLLQKIEELTLYSIEQNKQINRLKEENQIIKKQTSEIEELKRQVQALISSKK